MEGQARAGSGRGRCHGEKQDTEASGEREWNGLVAADAASREGGSGLGEAVGFGKALAVQYWAIGNELGLNSLMY